MDTELRVELSDLKGRVNNVAVRLDEHVTGTKAWQKENRETHRDLYQRTERPSWIVTTVISVLSALVAGLGVYTLTH